MIYNNKEFKVLDLPKSAVSQQTLQDKQLFLIQVPKGFDPALLDGLEVDLAEESSLVREEDSLYLRGDQQESAFLKHNFIALPSQTPDSNLEIISISSFPC